MSPEERLRLTLRRTVRDPVWWLNRLQNALFIWTCYLLILIVTLLQHLEENPRFQLWVASGNSLFSPPPWLLPLLITLVALQAVFHFAKPVARLSARWATSAAR